jgi:hypothetical protein
MLPRARCLHLLLAVTSLTLAAEPTGGRPPGIPTDFRLVAEENFDAEDSLRRWEMSDPRAWQHTADATSRTLELARPSRYQPPVRSPLNIALLVGQRFGDLILEAELQQTGKEYGHRDLCVFFGVQDATHFYYVHLATAADDHAHNIFLVNGQPRTKIATRTTPGIRWGDGVRHQVRLERLASTGRIRVYFDDLEHPIMEAEDRTFRAGAIGFGSFDDTGKVDQVRVWSPTAPTAGPRVFANPPTQP